MGLMNSSLTLFPYQKVHTEVVGAAMIYPQKNTGGEKYGPSNTYLQIMAATPPRLSKLTGYLFGIFMSFFVILFTFDAVAGERAQGTLSLMMSNQISRGQMLLAKYLGAFLTLMVPLMLGILMNLLIIYLSGNIPLDSSDYLRILGMVGLFALHISIFIFLGLFFSSRVSNAITSLVWLLLTWVCLALSFRAYSGFLLAPSDPIPSIEIVLLAKTCAIGKH